MATGPGLGFQYVDAGEVIALGSALPTVCILIVGLRFFTRRVQKIGLKADDWLALGALLLVVGMGACLIAGALRKAMGYPTPAPPPDLTEEEMEFYVAPSTKLEQLIEFPFQIMMVLAYGLIKMSYLFFYRRIFVIHSGHVVDKFLIGMVVVVALWTFTFEMLIIFACGTHVWANWSSAGWEAKYCVPVGYTSEYGLVVSDLILDGLIFLIPIPLVWKLQMNYKRKLAVSGVFLLGASAVGASIARLILYVKELQGLLTNADIDPQLTATVAYYWSLLEAGLALIAACLPPMAYLFTHWHEIPILSRLSSTVSGISLHNLGFTHRSDASQAPSEATRKESRSFVDKGALFTSQGSIARTVSIDVENQAARYGNPTAQTVPLWYPGRLDDGQGVC